MRAALGLLLLAAALSACSDDSGGADSGSDSPGPTVSSQAPAPDELSGTYDTSVELVASSCADIQVEDQPTTIEQAGTTLTLTHGPLTYTGTLDDGGRFTTEPEQVQVGPDTHRLEVVGTLHDLRLDAVVTAAVSGGQTCSYSVAWKGLKQ